MDNIQNTGKEKKKRKHRRKTSGLEFEQRVLRYDTKCMIYKIKN